MPYSDPEKNRESRRRYRRSTKGKKIAKKMWYLKRYNMSLDDLRRLEKKQKGRCAICGRKPTSGIHKSLNVDHDHETGKVRGLLCWDCNVAIGKLGDTVQGVEKAVRYLQKGL